MYYAAVLLGIVALLIGCPDDSGSGGGSDGDETGSAYTCANGTAVDGTTTNSNTERCSSCTDPYNLNSDIHTCQAAFTCTNGQAEPGFATGNTAIERCRTCADSYEFNNDTRTCQPASTCANGQVDGNTRTCNLILESTFNITDMRDLKLNGANGVTTAVVGTTTYLFVTGLGDDGVSVFSVADGTDAFTMPGDPDPVTLAAGTLTSVHNVSDDDTLQLNNAAGVTTAVVDTTTYLFVAGQNDDGVSVFSVADDGELTSVYNVSDNDTLQLDGAFRVTTAEIDDATYLFVAGFSDSGVSVFSVADNGMLTSVDDVSDDDTLQLDNAAGITTAIVGSTTYLFVTGLE